MHIRSIGPALACAAAALFAGQALAQTHAAAAPALPPSGPPITGVCVLSKEGLVAASNVGKYVEQRLQQLKSQTVAELNAEQQGIETDRNALIAQQATLPADQREQKATLIEQRIQAFQEKQQKRQAEMQQTAEKAFAHVIQEAEPIVLAAYSQRACSILLNADDLLLPATNMDLTPQVVQEMNAKLTPFQFDREQLPDQTGAPAR